VSQLVTLICQLMLFVSFLPMWYVSQMDLPNSILIMIVDMQMIEASIKEKMKLLEKIQKFKFVCSNCGICKDDVQTCADCKNYFCRHSSIIGGKKKECDVIEYCDRCKKSYCYYCRGCYSYGPPSEWPDGHTYCEKCNAHYYRNGVGTHHTYTKPKLEKL